MIIEGIREFLLACPLFEGKKINIDFLGENTNEFALFSSGEDTTVKKYASGDRIKQFAFDIRARRQYEKNAKVNIETNNFFEKLSSWIEKQNRSGNLPDLGEGKKAQNIEALSSAYLKSVNTADSVYNIRCNILYYEGGV